MDPARFFMGCCVSNHSKKQANQAVSSIIQNHNVSDLVVSQLIQFSIHILDYICQIKILKLELLCEKPTCIVLLPESEQSTINKSIHNN